MYTRTAKALGLGNFGRLVELRLLELRPRLRGTRGILKDCSYAGVDLEYDLCKNHDMYIKIYIHIDIHKSIYIIYIYICMYTYILVLTGNPGGSKYQLSKDSGSKTIPFMFFGAKELKYWVLGPSGSRSRSRI